MSLKNARCINFFMLNRQALKLEDDKAYFKKNANEKRKC